ncbi:MAG: hypothetical protein F6K19_06855 [Cyanothece sp. SIO1E1]|nr:hypothetical protein [Cyanothece sp. SIO1E1]
MKDLATLIYICLSISLLGQTDPIYSVKVQVKSYLNTESIGEKKHTHTFIFNGQGQLLAKENHTKSLVLAERDIGKNYKYTSYQYTEGKIWKETTQFITESGERFPSGTRIFTYENGRLTKIKQGPSPDSLFNSYSISYDDQGRKKRVNWLRAVYDTVNQVTNFTEYDTLTYLFHWDEWGRCQVHSVQSTLEFSDKGQVASLRSYQNGYLDQDFQLKSDGKGRLLRFSFEARSNYQNEEKTFHYSDPEGRLHKVSCRSELFTGGYSAKLQNISRSSYEFNYSDNFKDIPAKYLLAINRHLYKAFIPKLEEWQIYWP